MGDKAIAAIFIITLLAVSAAGWVMNITALVRLGMDQALTVEGVLRILGIPIAPIGIVMGWFV